MKEPTGSIDVTVQHTQGCAGTPPTLDLIKGVALEMNVAIHLREILVESHAQAAALKFLGSPTVQVNGLDIDPAARDNTSFGLA